MITMMDNSGQKIGMVMSIEEDQLSKWAESEDYKIDEMPEWSKTGKTKDILGYNCEQYIFSKEWFDENEVEEWWEGDDLQLSFPEFYECFMK